MDNADILILQNAALVLATLAEQFEETEDKRATEQLAMSVGNIALKCQAQNRMRDRETV